MELRRATRLYRALSASLGAGREQNLFAGNLGCIALTRSLFETDSLYYTPMGTTNADVESSKT
jgi:hypothetical protein